MIGFLLVAASIVALVWLALAAARDAWRQAMRSDDSAASTADPGVAAAAAWDVGRVRWTKLDDQQLTRLPKDAAS